MKRDDFIFSSTRIRSFEKQLLQTEFLNQMIQANSFADALELLGETRYRSHFSAGLDATDYKSILLSELSLLFHTVSDLAPDNQIIEYLFLKYFYYDLRVSTKTSVFNHKFISKQYDFVNCPEKISIQKDIEAYKEQINAVQLLTEKVKQLYALTNNPQMVDIGLDSDFFKRLQIISQKISSEFINTFTRDLIDFFNVMAFFRMKKQCQKTNLFEMVVVDGGAICSKDLISKYMGNEKDQRLSTLAMNANCNDYLINAIVNLERNADLLEFEKKQDEFQLISALNARRFLYGPEVLFGYVKSVESEIQNLRIILSGKELKLNPEMIGRNTRII